MLALGVARRSYSPLLGGIVERGISMNSCVTRIAAAAAILIAWTGAAAAHPGHGDAGGFAHGFMHPLGGLDHVLAMVAVGLYAATFVGVMALGGAAGVAGYALPYTEMSIALSVVTLGLAIALRVSLPTLAAVALAGVFAVFHGHAHGAEMPRDLSGYEYAAGFLAATALLHGAGIALGLGMGKLSELGGRRVTQAAGGAMALAGVALLVAVR
jgi:urease accessory protein